MKEVSELHKWLLFLRKKKTITGKQKEKEEEEGKKYRKLYTYIYIYLIISLFDQLITACSSFNKTVSPTVNRDLFILVLSRNSTY